MNGHDIIQAPVVAVSRHRIATDGEGVTTLVAFHSCPLRCRWCLNPHTWREGSVFTMYSVSQLLATVRLTGVSMGLAAVAPAILTSCDPMLDGDVIAPEYIALGENIVFRHVSEETVAQWDEKYSTEQSAE